MTAVTAATAASSPRTSAEAHDLYTDRFEAAITVRDDLNRRHNALGNGKLLTLGLAALTAWMGLGLNLLDTWLTLGPVIVFFALAVIHDRVINRLDHAKRVVEFYERGLERLEDRWTGKGVFGAQFRDPSHPYSEDLDLFGRGSLFELLCTARTRSGEETLAAWLTSEEERVVVRARQEAVAELAPRLGLREDLFILGGEVRSAIDPAAIEAWGLEPAKPIPISARLIAVSLAAFGASGLLVWAAGGGPWLFVAVAPLQALFVWRWSKRVRQTLSAIDKPAKDLRLLAEMLQRLERESFQSFLLCNLDANMTPDGKPPSHRIEQLEKLVDALQARRNFLFAPLGAVLLWTTQLAFAIEEWRLRNGKLIGAWVRTIGEFEALSALAGYAFEHPEDVFPEITEEAALWEAASVAHPLMPAQAAVRNDVSLGPDTRLYIVSGSNMSGKSTLLRTIGTNTVLALAGAPVRAKSLRLAPVRLGASIRTMDSLQAGVSRFYAEITRLRQIVDLTGQDRPALFLLDEILHGTNSHDRLIGAEAVVRTLLKRGAIGLVTTHDLALARVTEDPALHAVNVHFQDEMADGKMSFDYRLRPGVVEHSNAIALMRAVGLEV